MKTTRTANDAFQDHLQTVKAELLRLARKIESDEKEQKSNLWCWAASYGKIANDLKEINTFLGAPEDVSKDSPKEASPKMYVGSGALLALRRAARENKAKASPKLLK